MAPSSLQYEETVAAGVAATVADTCPAGTHMCAVLLRFRCSATEDAFAEHWAALRRPHDDTNMMRGLVMFLVLWVVRTRRALGMPDALAANVILRIVFLAHRMVAPRDGLGRRMRNTQAVMLHAVRWVAFPLFFAAEPRRCYHHVSGHIALICDALLGVAGTQLMMPLPWVAAVPAQLISAAVVGGALGLGPWRWCDTCSWLVTHADEDPSAAGLLSALDASMLSASAGGTLFAGFPQLFSLSSLSPTKRCVAVLRWVVLCFGVMMPLAVSYALETNARLAFAARRDVGRGGAAARNMLSTLPAVFLLLCAIAWPLCCTTLQAL